MSYSLNSASKDLWIFCADIGSVKAGKFGWFGAGPDGASVPRESTKERSIEELVRVVAEKITGSGKVALGFECPLYVPLREDPMLLTKARIGEGNRSWSAGAGCGALATGLVEVTWILQRIRTIAPQETPAFLDWREFQSADAGLFLWEAFVSGTVKGSDHAHDAKIAVERFRAALPNVESANALPEDGVFSLIGASLLRAGWSTNAQLVFKRCLVIKA